MSRHTLNDGVTSDPEITAGSFDQHWPELAPPPRLIGSYYKRQLPWEKFALAYLGHIRVDPTAHQRLLVLVALALRENVTVLCVEPSPNYCHRRLLAEECQHIDPTLHVVIS